MNVTVSIRRSCAIAQSLGDRDELEEKSECRENESGIVVRIKMPRVMMPYRFRDPPKFVSCFESEAVLGLEKFPQLETVRLQFEDNQPDSWYFCYMTEAHSKSHY